MSEDHLTQPNEPLSRSDEGPERGHVPAVETPNSNRSDTTTANDHRAIEGSESRGSSSLTIIGVLRILGVFVILTIVVRGCLRSKVIDAKSDTKKTDSVLQVSDGIDLLVKSDVYYGKAVRLPWCKVIGTAHIRDRGSIDFDIDLGRGQEIRAVFPPDEHAKEVVDLAQHGSKVRLTGELLGGVGGYERFFVIHRIEY